MRILLLSVLILIFSSCQNHTSNTEEVGEEINLKYAKGFTIEKFTGYKVITLRDVWRGEKSTYRYVLFKGEAPVGYEDATKIKVPINSIACMSLTHISFLEAIGCIESLVAISGGKYSHNSKVKLLMKSGKVSEIGSEQAIDYETLLERNPDIVMSYGIDGTSSKYTNKLKTLSLTPVLNAEYMEVHPLGKAEWIKFVAEFFDKSDIADSIFNSIESSYINLVNKTKEKISEAILKENDKYKHK